MNAEYAVALELAKGLAATPSQIERVASKTSQEAARWAFGQWDCRERGKTKFAAAESMLLTRTALEQATHERVAAYHASRFPPGVLVADLCCGIGGDLIALATRGPAIGFEVDPELAEHASHNLRVHGLEAEVRVASGLDHASDFEFVFADPSRRPGGRRTLDPSRFEPDPFALAEKMKEMNLAALKLSPMLDDDVLESFGGELEFVSFGGECREALVWLGRSVEVGRWAVQVETGSSIRAGPACFWSIEALDWIAEVDPAVIRAHALGVLGSSLGAAELGTSTGYLTADELPQSPWIRRFRVVYDGPWRPQEIQAELRSRKVRLSAIKTRARGVDPTLARAKLRDEGPVELVLMLYPVEKRVRAALVEPKD